MLRTPIILLVFAGCSSSNSWEVAHPSPDRLPSEYDYTIDVSLTSSNLLPLLPHPDSIAFEMGIGDSMQISDEFFSLSNVVMGPDGRTYIKQNHTNSIRVYDSSGKFEYSIGREGRGPGEFLRIGTFKMDRHDLLYINDEYGAKIEVFEKKEGRFTYSRSIYHKYNRAMDFCWLGDELFVSGESLPADMQNGELQNSGPIARINPTSGTVNLTFGYRYPSESGRYDLNLSASQLSCNENTKTVIAYSMYFPYIIGYSPEGDEKWRSNVVGFVSWEFIEFKTSEYKNPGLKHFTNRDIFNLKYPTQDISLGDYSLLQFGWTGPVMNRIPEPTPPIRSEDKEPRTRTILVHSETGELLHSDAYPPIGDIRNGRMVTYEIIQPYQILFSFNNLP